MSRTIAVLIVGIAFFGCAMQTTREMNPRENAAYQLTIEGRQLLNDGKPDNAIRLFERAIGLNPNDGECYYYLAEAWRTKGDKPEAREFNSLAMDYLKEDADWHERITQQRYLIESLPD